MLIGDGQFWCPLDKIGGMMGPWSLLPVGVAPNFPPSLRNDDFHVPPWFMGNSCPPRRGDPGLTLNFLTCTSYFSLDLGCAFWRILAGFRQNSAKRHHQEKMKLNIQSTRMCYNTILVIPVHFSWYLSTRFLQVVSQNKSKCGKMNWFVGMLMGRRRTQQPTIDGICKGDGLPGQER